MYIPVINKDAVFLNKFALDEVRFVFTFGMLIKCPSWSPPCYEVTNYVATHKM